MQTSQIPGRILLTTLFFLMEVLKVTQIFSFRNKMGPLIIHYDFFLKNQPNKQIPAQSQQ